MDEIQVDNGDITLRVEVTGEGPVVLCVHGWPEPSRIGVFVRRSIRRRAWTRDHAA